MGLISLIIAFEYTFFFMLQVIVGSDKRGTGMHAFSVVIFVLAMRKAVSCILTNNNKRTWEIIFGLAGFLALYLATGMIYRTVDLEYRGYLLAFGVRCIPAVFCAIVIADNASYFNQMQKWLQVLVLIYTIGVSIAVFTATDDIHLKEKFTVGINYQEISYSAAFAFNIDLYLVMFWNNIHKFRLLRSSFWRRVNAGILILLLYCMVSGGGRGAIVDIIAVTVFLLYVKRGFKLNVGFLLGGVIFIAFVFIGIYVFAQKTGDVGAKRLVSFFINRDEFKLDQRGILRENALKCFLNSPMIGGGIGSIFYTTGFYSHNIFTDILAEGGVILMSIAMGMFLSIFKNIKRLIIYNTNNCLVYIIFFSSFVMLIFSGYYLSDGGLWFSTTYLLITLSNIKKNAIEARMKRII